MRDRLQEGPSRGGFGEELARAFVSTSECYKFLFFKAILRHLQRGGGEEIPYGTLLADMVALVWWPAKRYRLRIGSAAGKSRLSGLLDLLPDDTDERLTDADVAALLADATRLQRARGALRHVPQRFLRPWLPELSGAPDGRVDRMTVELTRSLAPTGRLPYVIEDTGIRINPAWARYLADNMAIVSGWADQAWVGWLQARNDGVPHVEAKIGPPAGRTSLAEQRKFFLAGIRASGGGRCIYTGRPLSEDDLSLDHFLPWSFVAHDRIWNLTPVSRGVNSAKGARLPRAELLDRLAAVHHRMLVALEPEGDRWDRWRAQYADLHLATAELRDMDALRSAYRRTVEPSLAMARRMGFPDGWPPAMAA